MALGIDQTTPYNMTGASVEQLLLSQVFGDGVIGNMIAQYGTPMLNRMLGLEGPGYRSTLLDTTFMTNMTPFGVYNDNLRNRINLVASSALTRQNNAAKRGWLNSINQSKMSFESWQQTSMGSQYTNPIQAQEAYNAYIANETSGQMNNMLWNMGYNAIDPEGLNAANEYLQQAAANQIRFGANKGSRTAFLQARAIGNMFLNDQGEFDYDKTKYGYMNVGEASAIAAALTKEKDFFRGKDLKASDMKAAAKELQKTVQDYTEALSPLKDVFGSDIPAMIQTVEAMSGKKLSSLNPTRLQDMVAKVMANTVIGGYSVDQAVAMSTSMRNTIGQMNVPFTNQLGAMSQALTALNMTVTGLTPAYMTDERYRQNASQWVARTSNSSGAGYLNAAAAVWLDQNKGKTLTDFEAAYDDMRSRYGATEAMMRMTGAGSLYQLEAMGRQSSNFGMVTESDIGGSLSRREHLDTLIAAGWRKSTNRAAYTKAIDAIKNNAELLSDTAALEASTLSEDVKAQIRDIQAGMGMGGTGEALVTGLTAYAENERKRPMILRQQKMAKAMQDLQAWLPSGIGELAKGIALDGKTITELIQGTQALNTQDDEVKRTLISIEAATRIDATSRGLLDREGPVSNEAAAKYKDMLADNLRYGLLDAQTNQVYMDELMAYEEASQSGDEFSAREHALKMTIAKNVDEVRLSETIGMDGKGWSTVQDVWSRNLKTALNGGMSTEDAEKFASQEVADYMNYNDFEKRVGSSSILRGSARNNVLMALKNKFREGDLTDLDSAKSVVDELFKDKQIDERQRDVAYSALNQTFGKDTSSEASLIDIGDKIKTLISKIDPLVENLSKVITKEGIRVNHTVFGIGG